ncbi:PAS domain-containing protein, partial [candidate division KSB1 bacterium]|nr:PAS domain-containing protein [candidate division KSB1 bacterium]NIT69911.1 PAS domain-containing protein [candidate division KSB1 bacterium]NIX69592.1 PAS domain-containing protein [candidate division KSB1 bacterium]
LINSAMDAIIELNQNLDVTAINPAAKAAFQSLEHQIVDTNFSRLITEDSRSKLKMLLEALQKQPEGKQYMWIPGGLIVEPPEGQPFPAEATISRFEMNREFYYTIILRNVNE